MSALNAIYRAEIARSWRMHVVQALLPALALAGAFVLQHWLAWTLAGVLAALTGLAAFAIAIRRRAFVRQREEALAPGGVVAWAHEGATLTLWLRSGTVQELSSPDVDLEGAIRVRSVAEREALTGWCEVAGLVADVERELAADDVVAELAREPFERWARAWRARDPLEHQDGSIAALVRELHVQVIAARRYEESFGARATMAVLHGGTNPFVTEVATLQGRLQAKLEP